MKSNVWTFGDSLTHGFALDHEWSKKYIDWKGYVPKVYGELISEKVDFDLKNFGINGADNYTIFQKFCEVSGEIKKDDIVIFGWSSPLRFRIVDFERWVSILPKTIGDMTKYEFEDFSLTSIEEIIVNRKSIKYVEELNSWIKLINNTFKDVKVLHWTAFDEKTNGLIIKRLETISEETKNKVVDNHFSENGQYDLSRILLNKLGIIERFI